jgi:hypothetical protein
MFNPITGRPENIDALLRGPDSPLWTASLANKWACCAQGLSDNRPPEQHVAGTDAVSFIRPRQFLLDAKLPTPSLFALCVLAKPNFVAFA